MGNEPPAYPTIFAQVRARRSSAPTTTSCCRRCRTPVDYEAELAVVIGRPVRHATPEQAEAAIAGYTVLNDVSVRDWQFRTSQFLQGKTFEHTTPLGPCLVTPDELPDGRLGDQHRDRRGDAASARTPASSCSASVDLVAYLSTILTLNPGDVIATGTPGGVGHARKPPRYLTDGATMVTAIAGIGSCRNVCRAEELGTVLRTPRGDATVTPTVAQALAWAADGAAHLRGMMTRMGDDAFAKPSSLPDWTRAHVLTHVARNADALINLLDLGPHRRPDPGLRQPRAAQRGHRGRRQALARGDPRRPPRVVGPARRRRAGDAGGGLVGARASSAGAGSRPSDVLWLRAREVWIHAIDLDAGASFTDLPRPMLRELLTDAAATLGARPDFPRLLLAPTDESRTWTVGEVARTGAARGPRARRGARGVAARPVEGPRPAYRRGEAAAGATVMALTRDGARPGLCDPDFARARRVRPARRIPARGARRGRRGSRRAPRRGAGPGRRHGRRAGDDRPARVQGPRPGARRRRALRATRLPRALRHRRPRRRRRAGRGAGHRGAPARADGVPARRRRCRCTRPCSPRTPRACCPTARARPCCGGSTSTARASRCRSTCAGRWSGRGPGSTTRACRPPSTPGAIHPAIAALPEVGPLRRALAVRRGAIELELPEQEVVRAADGGWTVRVRQRTPVEDWNAEISLLTGITAARIMLDAGIGVLRTLPAAEPDAVDGAARGGPRAGHRLARGGDAGRAAVRAAPRHPRRAGPAPGRDVAAARRRLHRVRHRRRCPAARRPRTRRDRRAVRARHGAAAAAGRPVRHGAVPGRDGRRGRARLAARGPAHPARDDGGVRRRGRCGRPGVRRPDRGRAAGGPGRGGVRRRRAAGVDRHGARRGVPARPARAGPLHRSAAAGGDGAGAAGGGRPGDGSHRLHPAGDGCLAR